jgi:FkbM family methyltransferase
MRYSQYEEDDIIKEFFGEKVGKFLDLGAADGIKGSNSRALYERGWSGVCVEPNALLFSQLFDLYKKDPRVYLVNAALSDNGRQLTFHAADQLSTADTETVEGHMSRFFLGSYLIPSISCHRLAQLLTLKLPFDFISLDCEAMDLEIAGSSWKLFDGASLICYEHTLPGRRTDLEYRKKLRDIFESYGFTKEVAITQGNILLAR